MDVIELIKSDKLFKYLYRKNTYRSTELYEEITVYINWYFKQLKLDNVTIISSYKNFISDYNGDAKEFLKTSKYPLEIDPIERRVSRTDYDIILLMSVLLTEHRYKIMEFISQVKNHKEGNCLVVGCGPGLELSIVKESFSRIDAYDLNLNPVLYGLKGINYFEQIFNGNTEEKYDSILLIEILEHLSDPYALLNDCKKVLSETGSIICTTATNIPQFDHLYNFESDHKNFEDKVESLSLDIDYKNDIVHPFLTTNINSKNRIYRLKLKT